MRAAGGARGAPRRAARAVRTPRGRRRERGASAVVVALLLMVTGGFAALVLNVGHLMMVRGQLQNACDSAALAGAHELDGTAEGIERARAAAADYAARHATDRNLPVTIDPTADVTLGRWEWGEPKESAFTEMSPADPGALLEINAVLVKAGREGARGNPLEVYLPAFLGGTREADISADAVAVGGGISEAGCPLPIVFADCMVMKQDHLDCGVRLMLRNDTEDNMGFTNLAHLVHSVNTAGIIDALEGECRAVTTEHTIGVSNGSNLNKHVVDAFQPYVGQRVTAPIVSPPNGCPEENPKFNGLMPVKGFATFTLTRVDGPPNHAIHLELDCNGGKADKGRAGGGYFGVQAPRPNLVR